MTDKKEDELSKTDIVLAFLAMKEAEIEIESTRVELIDAHSKRKNLIDTM